MSARRTELGLALLLLVAYGWLFVFFPRINNPNELVRVYMARAIVEQHTMVIGRREILPGRRLADVGSLFTEWGWVNDRSLVCDDPRLKGPACAGKLYSGKAPGVSLFAVPFVAITNGLFGAIAHRLPSKDELVLVLRWALAILPTIALWLAVRRFLLAHQVDPPLALAAVLAGACGSLSLTFGQMVAGHQPTGIALAIAFLAVFWPDGTSEASARTRESWRAVIVGLGLTAAPLIEYQSAPAAFLIGLAWMLARWVPAGAKEAREGRGRMEIFFLLGAVPFTTVFAWFHTAVYGAPWKTGYSFLENAGFQKDIAPGFLGISVPTGERVWGSFFSPAMGLFFYAPWVALALGALPLALRAFRSEWPFGKLATLLRAGRAPVEPAPVDRTAGGDVEASGEHEGALPASGASAARRAEGLVVPAALAVFLYYLAFQSGHALWRSGWTIGPRYITPLVPFACIAVAVTLQRLAPAARALGAGFFGGAAAASIIATGLASSVCQGFPEEPIGPLAEVVAPLLAHGWVSRNLLQLAGVPGVWSALPSFAALAVAAALCIAAATRLEAPPVAKRRGLVLAAAIAALLTLGQWTAAAHGPPWPAAWYLASQWTPVTPPGAEPLPR